MKTIEQLEQEAKQAREEAVKEVSQYVPNAIEVADKLILASVAMVTYQFALGMEDADQIWNESGTKVISEKLPEVLQAQKERDSDGWIDWMGGKCPVKSSEIVEVKFRFPSMKSYIDLAWEYRWHHADKSGVVDGDPQGDIIAYRIVK